MNKFKDIKSSLIKRNVRFIYYHPYIILFISLFITGISLIFSFKLSIKSDLKALLPKEAKSVQSMQRLEERLGTTSDFIIVIESSSPKDNIRFLKKLASRLKQFEEIEYIQYFRDIRYFKKNALLFLTEKELKKLHQYVKDRIRQEIEKQTAIFEEEKKEEKIEIERLKDKYMPYRVSEYYESQGGKVVCLKARPRRPTTDIEFTKSLIQKVERVIARLDPKRYSSDMKVHITGDYPFKLEELSAVKRDVAFSGGFCFFMIVGLILIYFRRLRAVFLILIPLSMGIIWSVGIAYFLFGHLNIISAFIFAVLLGLGIDFGIHMLARYSEERQRGREILESLELVQLSTGKGAITAALTTSFTFFSLLIADFKGFSEFGVLAAIGVIMCLCCIFTVFPSLVVIWERFSPGVRYGSREIFLSCGGIFEIFTKRRYAFYIVIFGIIFASWSLFVLLRGGIEFEYDFSKLGRRTSEEKKAILRKEREAFRGEPTGPAILLTESLEATKKLHQRLQRLKATDERIDHFVSIFSFFPLNQEKKLKVLREIRETIDKKIGFLEGDERVRMEKFRNKLVEKRVALSEIPLWVRRQFTEKNGKFGRFVILQLRGNKSDYRETKSLVRDFGVIKAGKYHFSLVAPWVILVEAIDIMKKDTKRILIVACLVIFFILLFHFRSILRVIVVLVPLFIGVFWMVGVLYIGSIKLNMYNMLVLPTVLGIGIDSGIHLYHRYLEEGENSLGLVFRHTGGPVALAALTTMAGFSALTFAENQGMSSLGYLAVIGISMCLLSSLIFFPAFLRLKRILFSNLP